MKPIENNVWSNLNISVNFCRNNFQVKLEFYVVFRELVTNISMRNYRVTRAYYYCNNVLSFPGKMRRHLLISDRYEFPSKYFILRYRQIKGSAHCGVPKMHYKTIFLNFLGLIPQISEVPKKSKYVFFILKSVDIN